MEYTITNDAINAGFEFFGIWFVLHNCWTVWQDKAVAGVSVPAIVFWTTWGGWNVYYYPSLGQMFSFYCGIGVLLANLLYVSMLLYYKYR